MSHFSRIRVVVAVAFASAGQPADARAPMTVATFLATHDRLSHSRDELNVGGADFYATSLLKSIYDSGSKAIRMNEVATKAGHRLFCLPIGAKGFPLHIEELHAFLETIPTEGRGMSIDEGMLRFTEHLFPCVTKP